MSEPVLVIVNCPSAAEAAEIASHVLHRRLAASANISQPVNSIYWWQGDLVERDEVPLTLRTRADLFADLAGTVERLHSYETPSIVAVRVADASPSYAAWLQAETAPPTQTG